VKFGLPQVRARQLIIQALTFDAAGVWATGVPLPGAPNHHSFEEERAERLLLLWVTAKKCHWHQNTAPVL
jgi:hypothetical protein